MDILKNLIVFIFVFSQSLFAEPINIKDNSSLSAKSQDYQILYFWATWCPDCKEKLKSDLHKYASSQVGFSAISIESDKEKIMNYVVKNNFNYDFYFDNEKKTQKQFKVFTVPTVVLVRKVGGSYEHIKTVVGKDWSEFDTELNKIKMGVK